MAIGEILKIAAQSASDAIEGMMRSSSQIATANIRIPKIYLTLSIQPPARGSLDTPAPIKMSGAPMPRLITNSDNPPSKASPV